MSQSFTNTNSVVVGENRKYVDVGPCSKPLVWSLQKETFELHVQGQRVIAVDTNKQQSKSYTNIPLDQIEELIEMTPKYLRNFYEMIVCNDGLEFETKLYYDYDWQGKVFSLEKKQEVFEKIRTRTTEAFKKHFNVDLNQNNLSRWTVLLIQKQVCMLLSLENISRMFTFLKN